MSYFNKPRQYPFRDYASVRRPFLEQGSDEMEILRRQYAAKCIELARLQKSYEMLESRFNELREDYRELVCRQNEGQGKPRGGRFGASWGARLLAALASLLPR